MAVPDAGETMHLPPDFTTIEDLLEGKVAQGGLVNVVGVAKDLRKPIPTKGKDHKATIRLIDYSSSSPNRDIEFNIFRAKEDMPDVGSGDIVVVYKAKYQSFRSERFSLITNIITAIHVYPAAKIPPSPTQPASCPLKFSQQDSKHNPALKAGQYVSWLFHNINKDYVPDVEQFQIQATRSLNVKNKLCELKDAKDGTFHDIIAQVVQEPHDYGDKIRLYVSDYTENSGFFNHMRTSQAGESSRDGDPFGYTTVKDSTSSNWNGPFGKRSLQVTCWEPHATVIRNRVKNSSWVHLFNVQFKFGSDGMNLEGYLREDQNAFSNKISVDVFDLSEDPEHIHPSMKNAIRRKRDYEKGEKALRKDLQSTQTRSKKRPAPGQPEDKPLNAKQRRAAQRAQIEGKAKQDLAPADASLNTQVVTEHPEQAISPVCDILKPAKYETTYQDAPLLLDLPFNCAKYRTNVRVIDFYPNRLQDFARARKQQAEYETLSDYSGEESESEEGEEGGTLDSFVSASDRIWEWRFALRLQDVTAMPKPPKSQNDNSFWVVVGNMDAQLLTNLDACDLRVSPEELAQLRERMFILWGDLEEKKSKELANKRKQKANPGKKTASDRPPDSSDNEGPSGSSKKTETVSNRPFTCCICQYGIQVKELNTDKANAGEGKRWKRMFGLFGTKICYNK